MTNTTEALKQAIWILTTIKENKRNYETRWIGETINACKEALESQEQEPVAWMYQREDGVGTLNFDRNFALIDKGYKEVPLYTHPAQPLSDDEIKLMYGGLKVWEANQIIVAFARAIEQAHGIK